RHQAGDPGRLTGDASRRTIRCSRPRGHDSFLGVHSSPMPPRLLSLVGAPRHGVVGSPCNTGGVERETPGSPNLPGGTYNSPAKAKGTTACSGRQGTAKPLGCTPVETRLPG